ncbi:unnamed protein product [Didymodactylos carnosus]|uniref:CHCH domain-containing protein n=1 Tax=Didymodactylos carnosus TaxID=1234261 RepID=A0A813S3Y1_9BILA|nr:unnamed protein product [Didymodactylos carnosus]CAF1029826.1 unnamed protein product [Didymodactylos carnosus]CAF3573729.1 unnamed protein product [Didymodactylos carnosus]CAF3798115.1 unnamed protein product [Didymodactylos carnosus]
MNIMLTCLKAADYDNYACEQEVQKFYACVQEYDTNNAVVKNMVKADSDQAHKFKNKRGQPAWLTNKLLKEYPTPTKIE